MDDMFPYDLPMDGDKNIDWMNKGGSTRPQHPMRKSMRGKSQESSGLIL